MDSPTKNPDFLFSATAVITIVARDAIVVVTVNLSESLTQLCLISMVSDWRKH
jgi:hypothetical protein